MENISVQMYQYCVTPLNFVRCLNILEISIWNVVHGFFPYKASNFCKIFHFLWSQKLGLKNILFLETSKIFNDYNCHKKSCTQQNDIENLQKSIVRQTHLFLMNVFKLFIEKSIICLNFFYVGHFFVYLRKYSEIS